MFKENKSLQKIEQFRNLDKGWHYNEGVPTTQEIARKAITLIRNSPFDTDVFPGIDGEIMVTMYHKKHYWEYTIETYGKVTFVHQINNKDVAYDDHISFNSVLENLNG